MAVSTGTIRSDRVQRVFGYGAAATMTPYLAIKVSWVVGAVLGFLPAYAGMNVTAFVTLNVATIVMSSVAIVLALALVRPWGARIRALPLLAAAWIGAGFLIPMLPYMALTTVLDKGSDSGSGGMPGWEATLIEASFIGWAVGLAVALPLYLRSRWPAAFEGRLAVSAPRVAPVVLAVVLGALMLFWAVGGTAGLAHPGLRALDWRLQTANTALWAFVGAWGVWSLSRPRRTWLAVTATWIASGFLVAWSAWKLPFTAFLALRAPLWPEQLGVAAVVDAVGVLTGALMLATVLRVQRSHRDAGA